MLSSSGDNGWEVLQFRSSTRNHRTTPCNAVHAIEHRTPQGKGDSWYLEIRRRGPTCFSISYTKTNNYSIEVYWKCSIASHAITAQTARMFVPLPPLLIPAFPPPRHTRAVAISGTIMTLFTSNLVVKRISRIYKPISCIDTELNTTLSDNLLNTTLTSTLVFFYVFTMHFCNVLNLKTY